MNTLTPIEVRHTDIKYPGCHLFEDWLNKETKEYGTGRDTIEAICREELWFLKKNHATLDIVVFMGKVRTELIKRYPQFREIFLKFPIIDQKRRRFLDFLNYLSIDRSDFIRQIGVNSEFKRRMDDTRERVSKATIISPKKQKGRGEPSPIET